MKKNKLEKDVNLNSLWRKIKDFFYSISVFIHGKLPKKKEKTAKSGNIGEFVFFHLLWLLPMIQFAIVYLFVGVQSILLAFQTYDRMTGQFI